MQIIAEAIKRSKSHNEIVTLTRDEIARSLGSNSDQTIQAALDELYAECEDEAEGDGVIEFWGQDTDGIDWRVHVVTG